MSRPALESAQGENVAPERAGERVEGAGLPVPTMTATTGGKRTNRVTVKGRRRSSRNVSPPQALASYRKDPSTRGLDYVQVCISMPVSELAALDEIAEGVQMARSHFIRQAVKHFAAKVRP